MEGKKISKSFIMGAILRIMFVVMAKAVTQFPTGLEACFMPAVLLRLPDLGTYSTDRPRACPYCGSQILQSWGQVSKTIQDTQDRVAEVARYRCSECGRTFREYPDGIDRSNISLRIRYLAGLIWAMGMSTREVVELFDELGVQLSRMTVWRDGQGILERLGNVNGSTSRYCINRNSLHHTNKFGVMVALDLGNGKSILLGTLDEINPRKVKTWLEPLAEEIEIEISLMGTDLLNHYRMKGYYRPPSPKSSDWTPAPEHHEP
jgi:DNA-directed RNA polymerase subunit RPC12/RpoP